MDNKTCPCFVAFLFDLSDNALNLQNNYEQLNMSIVKVKPLILFDFDQLKLFRKLTEKTSTEDESISRMLIRQEIPDFYKNINVAFSWQFREIIRKMYSNMIEL
jgi:hypothetical protein